MNHLKDTYNVSEGKVLPVFLGSRGTITPSTEAKLKSIGITDSVTKTMVLNVLRSSIEMSNMFIDG